MQAPLSARKQRLGEAREALDRSQRLGRPSDGLEAVEVFVQLDR
jgi:hypothetical protein